MWGNLSWGFHQRGAPAKERLIFISPRAAPSSGHWPKTPTPSAKNWWKKKNSWKGHVFHHVSTAELKNIMRHFRYVPHAERCRNEEGGMWTSVSTHAGVRQCAGSSSASPLRSSGNGCVSSCSPESRSPWRCPLGMEEQTRAGPASPGESYADGERDVTNTDTVNIAN